MIRATDFYSEADYLAALEDRAATPTEAMAEYVANVGGDPRNVSRQWLLTDYDVWVKNPHYVGPAQRHPEDDGD